MQIRVASSMGRISLATLWLLLGISTAAADEGQWTPDQISQLDFEMMKARGLELSAKQLWDPDGDERNGGLMRAAVNLSGCSASFVSPEGLIATNHHCAYSAIQANSTVEHDYLNDGYLAATRTDELRAPGKTIRVLRSVQDVTETIDAARASAASGDYKSLDDMYVAITNAVDTASRELVSACESKSVGLRCNVASFHNGSFFRINEYVELKDVRLVYAPPASIGEYGGEIDNWMWPRHTGDFSLLRAYVGPDGTPEDFSEENIPYKPGVHLRVSPDGVSPGDFVAILGYPGRTQRYQPAAEVARGVDQVLPFIVDFYGEWISILDRLGSQDPELELKVASLKKGLANRHKNARGMLAGIAQMDLTSARHAEDEALSDWIEEGGDERARAYGDVLDKLTALSDQTRTTHERDVIVSSLRRGPSLLAIAIDLVRKTKLASADDSKRPLAFTSRRADALWARQERRLRDLSLDVDAEVFTMLAHRLQKLPSRQRPEGLDRVLSGANRASDITASREMFASTMLGDPATLRELWEGDNVASLRALNDPLVDLALTLVPLIETIESHSKARIGEANTLYPRYFDMLRATREGPVYPDANSTLRFSHAAVMGYQKWDGAPQSPQTTLAGAVAKHTGKDPFDLPKRVRRRARVAKSTYWSDPQLGDLPLCFLSNGDTTGGNSGSPVIDGKGRLVGLNFDRVWENIAGDYGFNQGHSRNISVDIRYLLWMLDEVEGGRSLLAEMGLAQYADAPPRPSARTGDGRPPGTRMPAGCSCDVSPDSAPWAPPALLAMLLLVAPRRRRAHR